MTNAVGSVAKCKRGIIGIVLNKKGDVYFGITLRGRPWQAVEPQMLADSVYDYIIDNLEDNDFREDIQGGSPCKIKRKV